MSSFLRQVNAKYRVLGGKELDKFVAYCMGFYGKDGIYPIKGIKPEMIRDAVGELALTDHNFGGGDTMDREKVRDVILKELGLNKRSSLS